MKKIITNILIIMTLMASTGSVMANHSDNVIKCLENENYECVKKELELSISEEDAHSNALFLGDLYLFGGRGVVQNNDLAIYNYKLALISGNLPKYLRKEAAFGIAMAHNNKVLELNWTDGPGFGENVILAYAWFMIAHSYGKESWKSENGETIKINTVLNFYNQKIAENGVDLAKIAQRTQKIKELIDKESQFIDDALE